MSLPRLASIKASIGSGVQFKLRDGRSFSADLSGVISRLRAFAQLDEAAVFQKVKVIDDGVAAGWPLGGEDAELSAQTLVRIAEAQKATSGSAFVKWMTAQKLTVTDAAQIFDVTDRTIKRWRVAAEVPLVTGILMRQIADDPALLGALLARKGKRVA